MNDDARASIRAVDTILSASPCTCNGPGGDVRGVERSRRARVHRLKAGEEDRESHRVPEGRDERERERGGGRALRETQDAVERAV